MRRGEEERDESESPLAYTRGFWTGLLNEPYDFVIEIYIRVGDRGGKHIW